MAPVTPHWHQPSHPSVQEVIITGTSTDYNSKSLSKVSLPPFAVYAKLAFPPCTMASEPTYATVQMGKDKHLNLNSDLLYINHSCDPSLIFDTGNLNILVGPKGLNPGDELTFFYPSTEWEMAQPFTCLCSSPLCRGTISGAKAMPPSKLEGYWLNGHILDAQRQSQQSQPRQSESIPENGDATSQALGDAVSQAEKVVEAARLALEMYLGDQAGVVHGQSKGLGNGVGRRGVSSRELSGEMGGDTRAC